MTAIDTRAHPDTAASRLIQRWVSTFDANAARVVARVHGEHDEAHFPAPLIADLVAERCDEDDLILAQFCGGEAHASFLDEVAAAVVEELRALVADDGRGTVSKIEKHIGRRLAHDVNLRLSNADTLRMLRLPASEAKAICEAKAKANAQKLREATEWPAMKPNQKKKGAKA